MTRFCLAVTFLDPVPAFHGRRDADEPEWPPVAITSISSIG